jgi:hypothetical protein
MTINDLQDPIVGLAAYSELVRDELKRRFGVPFPDGLRRDVERGHAAQVLPTALVAEWGQRFDLTDLPPRSAR